MPFLSFPLEILQLIAVCVEAAHRPSLQAFSLTSKACHQAVLLVMFRRITITVRDREGLRRDVDALMEALERTNSFRHIQKINIKGALRLQTKPDQVYGPQTPYSVISGRNEILNEEPVHYSGLYAVFDEPVIQRSSEEDMAWAPVINLLQAQLPLKDLVYDCHSQFPPSLLTTLHEQHPKCRLHHLTFKFRTLVWGGPYPYEMELATSPSLYRAKVTCAQRDSEGDDDFNLEAMMELTTGLAPNLDEVVILNLRPGRSLRFSRPRGTFLGLPGSTWGKKGSLKSLSLKGFTRLRTPAILQDWARHVDFARLQNLALGGYWDEITSGLSGETMEWIAQTQSFPNVKTLEVYLTRNDMYVERPAYSAQAIAFFQVFEPLEQLAIDGPIDLEILDSVLSHHGPTLRRLTLHPFEQKPIAHPNPRDLREIPFQFTKERVLQIEAHCPVLQELTIKVKRDTSSPSEAEVYRCLGQIGSLRSLFIILDCSNWRIFRDPTYDPNFAEEDQKPVHSQEYPCLKRGDLKEAFINCAVDEALAQSIWNTISQIKTGRQLERLKLWPTGAGEYGYSKCLPPTFTDIASHLSRSWLFERIPRDDTEDVVVTELGREQRKAQDELHANYLAYGHNPEIWEVFRSIWPSKNGSKDWSDDWSSVPL